MLSLLSVNAVLTDECSAYGSSHTPKLKRVGYLVYCKNARIFATVLRTRYSHERSGASVKTESENCWRARLARSARALISHPASGDLK